MQAHSQTQVVNCFNICLAKLAQTTLFQSAFCLKCIFGTIRDKNFYWKLRRSTVNLNGIVYIILQSVFSFRFNCCCFFSFHFSSVVICILRFLLYIIKWFVYLFDILYYSTKSFFLTLLKYKCVCNIVLYAFGVADKRE